MRQWKESAAASETRAENKQRHFRRVLAECAAFRWLFALARLPLLWARLSMCRRPSRCYCIRLVAHPYSIHTAGRRANILQVLHGLEGCSQCLITAYAQERYAIVLSFVCVSRRRMSMYTHTDTHCSHCAAISDWLMASCSSARRCETRRQPPSH